MLTRDEAARLLPPVLDVLPYPMAVVDQASRRVLVANRAWLQLAENFGAAGAAAGLQDIFAAAMPLFDDHMLKLGGVARRAVAACVPQAGVATWWDLDLVPHPDRPDAVLFSARDVTDNVLARREAEEAQQALSATGTRLHLAQDITGIGTWEWDTATGAQSWSPEQFLLHGLDPSGRAPPTFAEWLDMVVPEDRPAIIAAAGTGFQSSHGAHLQEFRIRRADTGEARWLLTQARTVAVAPDGRPLRVIGVNIDVTRRKHVQEALRASEAQLHLAENAAGTFGWVWHVPSGGLTWMEGLEAAMGLAPGSFGGTIDAFRAMLHPDEAAEVQAAMMRALAGETPVFSQEFRMRRADGTWRWTSTQGLVQRDPNGAPLRVVGVDHDLTSRRAVEDALRNNQARLRLAMEVAGLGAWEVDTATNHVIWDGNLAAMLGIPAERAAEFGTKWVEFIHPDDVRRVQTEIAAAATAGRPFAGQCRIIRADSTHGVFETRAVLAGPGRLVGVVRDVTQERAADQALRDSEARFRGIFDSTFQFIGLLHVDGTVLEANRAALEFGGFAADTVIGRKLWDTPWIPDTPDFAAPDAGIHRSGARGQVRQAVARAADGHFARFELELRGADRATLIDFSVRPVIGRDGQVISLVYEGRDIGALKSAHGTLSEAVGALQALMDTTSDCIALLDEAYGVQFINQPGQRMLAITDIGAVVGAPIWALWPEPARLEFRNTLRNAMAERGGDDRAAALKFQVNASGGQRARSWDITVRALPPQDDASAHLLLVARETTEHPYVRYGLQDLLQVIERSRDLIATANPDGQLTYLNRGGREMIGLDDAAAADSLHFSDFVAPEWQDAYRNQVVPNALKFGMWDAEMQIINVRTKARIDVERTTFALHDSSGAFCGYGTVSRDVTAARQAQRALAESEGRFRSLVEAMPHIAYTALPNGITDFVNQQWYDFTGQAPGLALGRGWTQVLHPDDRQPTFAAWNAALKTGEPFTIEHRLRGIDGTYYWFQTRAVPLRDPERGGILRWFGSSANISDIVAAREAASRAAEDLEVRVAERTRSLADVARVLENEIRRRESAQSALLQAQKLEALGLLTGSVAHDFNNVLAAIVGSYQLIRRRTDEAAVLAMVARGEEAAERATKLIRQLLTFTRREALSPEILLLPTALAGTEDLIRHAVGRTVKCALDVEPETWPVLADLHQMEIALLNLAVNARDAMPSGGTLTIGARNLHPAQHPHHLPPGDYVSVWVRDSGHGMPPETLARAVEPFFTTKPQGRGTGLGLAMVQSFVSQSGGHLLIDSKPDEGTTVQIILPRAALAAGPDARAIPEGAAGQEARHGGATILLVEDDDQVRALTARHLRRLGYEVAEAASCEVALAIVHTMAHVDLLLTAINLPGVDGPGLLNRLRSERPSLPVVYVTGRSGLAPAGALVLTKPYSQATLAGLVLEGLGRRAPAEAMVQDRILARVRSPSLRTAYLAWMAARGPGRPLPAPGDLDAEALGLADHAFRADVAAIEPPRFRYSYVGDALNRRLGRKLEVNDASAAPDHAALEQQDIVGLLQGAYRRCARTQVPVYQFARYDLGDGPALCFERLLLPVSADGETVTQLLGISLFSDESSAAAADEDPSTTLH